MPNVNKVDWSTWLVSDLQNAGSDNDLDYEDTEEEEEAEELSDNDLSDVELDHVETVYELCVEVSQAQVFVAYQEQERKMLKDKIGSLEQQLESLQKAAALEMSAREALESSAKEAIEQAAEGKKAVEAANIAVAEAMQRGCVSLMPVCFLAVFCHAFPWGVAAPVAVFCAAWTLGPIT